MCTGKADVQTYLGPVRCAVYTANHRPVYTDFFMYAARNPFSWSRVIKKEPPASYYVRTSTIELKRPLFFSDARDCDEDITDKASIWALLRFEIDLVKRKTTLKSSPHKRNPNFIVEFMACVTAKSRRGKVQACLLIYQRFGSTFLSDKPRLPCCQ